MRQPRASMMLGAVRPLAFNLGDLFEIVADALPERVALVRGDRRLTYRALDERATRLAHGLRDRGVPPGAHVGLFLTTTIEHVEALLGCFKARAVPINLNYRYTPDELAHLVDDADLVAMLFDAELAPTVEAALARGARPRLLGRVGGAASSSALDAIPFEELLAAGSPVRDLGPRSPEDRYVLYTGGTTGSPKGVVWRQEDVFFAVMGGGNPGGPPIERPEEIADTVLTNRAQRLGPFLPAGDPGPDVFVSLALGPLMHASGQWSALGALLGGGTVVLYHLPHLDMNEVLTLVERERVVSLNLVGDASARPLLRALEARPGAFDTSSLRLLGSGGTILSGDVKDRLLAALPSVVAILEAVGSSESPAQAIAVARPGVPSPTLEFTARPETMIVDDDLRPIPPGSGRVGRLATRGRVPLGYHKDPERSARAFVEIDGERWALPGDVATMDADGTVRLIGRGAQCINTGGEKVYPGEVEAVLVSHPRVADAVVVGVPDERWGERVTAVFAADDPTLPPTLEELQAHCRARLAGYKVPRAVCLVDTVRRSPAGKADYRWAQERAAIGGDAS